MTKIINGVASEFEFPADTGVFTQNVFEKENQELKKQVDEYKKQLKPNYYVKGLEGTLKEYQQEMNKVATQQKGFIKYLEDEIQQQETVIAENQEKSYFSIYEDEKENLKLSSQKAYTRRKILEEILKKYKKIIEVNDEKES